MRFALHEPALRILQEELFSQEEIAFKSSKYRNGLLRSQNYRIIANLVPWYVIFRI
jgi:hypothetical protein